MNHSETDATVRWDNPESLIDGFGWLTFHSESCDNACAEYTTIKVPVVTTTAEIQGATQTCVGSQYQYTLPAWPATVFEWEVNNTTLAEIVAPPDNGREVYIHFKKSGTCTLSVRYHNTLLGCSGQAQKIIQVRQATTIDSEEWDGNPICRNTVLSFSNLHGTTPVNGQWLLLRPDGTTQQSEGSQFTHTYTQAGTYTLSVTSPNYCSPDPIQIMVAAPPPLVNGIEGAREVCTGKSYSYSADTTVKGTAYAWKAIGGSVLKQENDNVTVVWNTLPAKLVVRRHQTAAPYCYSDSIFIVITSLLDADYEIVACDGDNSEMYPHCQRSFCLMKDSRVFTEASNNEWSLAGCGGFSLTGNHSPSVTVMAHLVSSACTTQLTNRFTVCDNILSESITIGMELLPTPIIVAPDTVCPNREYTFSLQNADDYDVISWHVGDNVYPSASASISFGNNSMNCRTDEVILHVATSCSYTETIPVAVVVRPEPDGEIQRNGNQLEITTTFPSTFEWSGNGTTILTEENTKTSVITIDPSISATYECLIVDEKTGCKKTVRYIAVPPSPPCSGCVTLRAVDSLPCEGKYILEATGAFSRCRWSSSDPLMIIEGNDRESTVSCRAMQAGRYPVMVTVDGLPEGCCTSYQIVVTAPLIPDIEAVYTCDDDGINPMLKIQDLSTAYPANVNRDAVIQWYNNGAWQTLTFPYSISDPTPGATYQFRVKTWLVGENDTCMKEIAYTVPSLPAISFTATENPTCENLPIQLTPSDLTYSSYTWDLADGAMENIPTPIRSFNVPDDDGDDENNGEELNDDNNEVNTADTVLRTIALTVEDQYGCRATSSMLVTVYNNLLGGKISYDDEVVCVGTTVTLSYTTNANNTTYNIPDFYEWMPENATTASIDVTTPTRYTLTVSDNHHCQYRMGPDGANIIDPSVPIIIGDADVCVEEAIQLTGISLNDSIVSYYWYADGNYSTTIGQEKTLLLEPFSSPGTHTYRLRAVFANNCSKTSDFTFTVHDLPEQPGINHELLSCQPYRFGLYAIPDSTRGSFVWSNGAGSDSIVVEHGGRFNVTYIDVHGCKSRSANIHIPNSPDSYAWTFPVGCYEFCPTELPRFVYGPVWWWESSLWSWTWYRNNVAIATGNGSGFSEYGLQPPLRIDGPGSYSWILNNGYCSDTIGTAHVTVLDASTCVNCQFTIEEMDFCAMRDGSIRGTFCLNNPLTVPLNYLITSVSPTGIYYNAQGEMQPGVQTYTHYLYPDQSPYPEMIRGTISVWYPEPLNIHCHQLFEKILSGSCDNEDGGGTQEMANAPRDSIQAMKKSVLRLYPNPTDGGVWVEVVADTAASIEEENTIVVRNIVGQVVATSTVDAAASPFYLTLTDFAAGVYTVEYRRAGKLVAVQKLVKQ